jgi:CMP-N-acetylneuraminic acid synthetase
MRGKTTRVALLPMKAHSERVSGKNFREFAGKPLFRWMLDKLVELAEVDFVVINTDARPILESHSVSSGGKILIRDRKSYLCGDCVSMNRIIEDDIREFEAGAYLMTHTTNPLLSTETMLRALSVFEKEREENAYDSLFSVTKHQARFYRKNGEAINHDPNNLVRTQDLEPWFEDNSSLYIFTRESFARTGARIGERPFLFQTPRAEAVDIDDPETWAIAEGMVKSASIQVTPMIHSIKAAAASSF